MGLSRSLTSRICRVLIGVLLFAQLAVAAHACPALGAKSSSLGHGMTSASGHGMSPPTAAAQDESLSADMAAGCEQMGQLDPSAPNLCLEHCGAGHQSSDTAPLPVVSAATPALLYVLPAELEPVAGSSPSRFATDLRIASAPPPHAILHCVLRI